MTRALVRLIALPCLAAIIVAIAGCRAAEPADVSQNAQTVPAATGQNAHPADPSTPPTTAPPTSDPPTSADTWADGVYTSQHFNLRITLPEGYDVVDPGAAPGDTAEPLAGDDADTTAGPPPYFVSADGMRFPAQLDGSGPLGIERSADSLTFVGPVASEIYMVVGDTESAQLAASTFRNLDTRLGLGDVAFDERTIVNGTLNSIPAVRVEGRASVRGHAEPVRVAGVVLDMAQGPVAVALLVPDTIADECYPASPDDGLRPVTLGAACPAGTLIEAMRAVIERIEVADLRGG